MTLIEVGEGGFVTAPGSFDQARVVHTLYCSRATKGYGGKLARVNLLLRRWGGAKMAM